MGDGCAAIPAHRSTLVVLRPIDMVVISIILALTIAGERMPWLRIMAWP
jgi:hypothetical protein